MHSLTHNKYSLQLSDAISGIPFEELTTEVYISLAKRFYSGSLNTVFLNTEQDGKGNTLRIDCYETIAIPEIYANKFPCVIISEIVNEKIKVKSKLLIRGKQAIGGVVVFKGQRYIGVSSRLIQDDNTNKYLFELYKFSKEGIIEDLPFNTLDFSTLNPLTYTGIFPVFNSVSGVSEDGKYVSYVLALSNDTVNITHSIFGLLEVKEATITNVTGITLDNPPDFGIYYPQPNTIIYKEKGNFYNIISAFDQYDPMQRGKSKYSTIISYKFTSKLYQTGKIQNPHLTQGFDLNSDRNRIIAVTNHIDLPDSPYQGQVQDLPNEWDIASRGNELRLYRFNPTSCKHAISLIGSQKIDSFGTQVKFSEKGNLIALVSSIEQIIFAGLSSVEAKAFSTGILTLYEFKDDKLELNDFKSTAPLTLNIAWKDNLLAVCGQPTPISKDILLWKIVKNDRILGQ